MSGINEIIIYTIGHSTRTLDEFLQLIKTSKINIVIDVRAIPHSKHNNQFNKTPLFEALKAEGIKYIHMPELGGLRRPQTDSVNSALENKSFRGYADYMETRLFKENLLRLVALAKENCLVIMCAEALPWRCHRALLSDALVVRNIKVKHILNENNYSNHEINPLAQVEGTKITYSISIKQKAQRALTDFGSSA